MSETASSCYHCGLPVLPGSGWQVHIAGAPRAMCCPGCQAVAQAIVDNGLSDYYRHRDAMPEQAQELVPTALQELKLYDHPDIQRAFVREPLPGEREADLMLEGITCAACVWLNEAHLAKQPGISAVQVNYATRRARVRWREGETQLSAILAAVAAIGYRAHPFDPENAERIALRERKAALWRVFVAGFGMMQVMMYAYPAYIAQDGDLSPTAAQIMRWASLILTLPVVLYAAAPFFQRAWRDLRLGRLGMDVPVALGVGSAFLASVWATLAGQGEVYFDSVTMFVFFLLGGRYFEMLARQRALRGAEVLSRVMPAFARRLSANGEAGNVERIPVAQLVVGDHISVWPGETIAVDGAVIAGDSEVNEAWLTGESRAQRRSAGDAVLCGSVNISSPLTVVVRQLGDSTRLAGIRQLMERAALGRPRVVELADRVARHFVGAVLLMACITALVWWQIDADRALWVFVSVLVVSCPCALSLATPAALTVATEIFARRGLLVTRAHAIETLARADHFVFDKTGTLTTGHMQLVAVEAVGGLSNEDAVGIAAALARHAGHPLTRAIVDADTRPARAASVVLATSGQGMQGEVDGRVYVIGRREHVAQRAAINAQPAWPAGDHSEVLLGSAGQWLARFVFDDTVRADAPALISGLQQDACATTILSGDLPGAVQRVATQLGITDARAALSPEGKHAAVQAMQAHGAVVAMVGDGVNDAPVMALAQLSVAPSGGTELARNQADIVILNDAIGTLAEGRALARRTLRIVRQNLGWAAAYNLLSIPAAMAGWVTPWMAGIGMGASSLLVVLNALRLARK